MIMETRELWFRDDDQRAEAIMAHVYDGVTGPGWGVVVSTLITGEEVATQVRGGAATMVEAHAICDAILATYVHLMGERVIRLDQWMSCSCPVGVAA